MRNFFVKISVNVARGKRGRRLRAPYDAVEFLPRVAEIVAVEVDDHDLAVLYHHIAYVIITVLIALRTVAEQMAVCLEVVEYVMITVEFQRTLGVHPDLAVDLRVEPRLPIGLIIGGGD